MQNISTNCDVEIFYSIIRKVIKYISSFTIIRNNIIILE